MEKQFKTNIKCAACVEKVTPILNTKVGIGKWKVDLAHPERILSLVEPVEEQALAEALLKVGYHAEKRLP